MSNSSIRPIDRTLSGATTLGQSGPRSNGNEGVFRITQSSSITGTSPSDCFVSYPGYSLMGGVLPPLKKCSQYILQPQPTGLRCRFMQLPTIQNLNFEVNSSYLKWNSNTVHRFHFLRSYQQVCISAIFYGCKWGKQESIVKKKKNLIKLRKNKQNTNPSGIAKTKKNGMQ